MTRITKTNHISIMGSKCMCVQWILAGKYDIQVYLIVQRKRKSYARISIGYYDLCSNGS